MMSLEVIRTNDVGLSVNAFQRQFVWIILWSMSSKDRNEKDRGEKGKERGGRQILDVIAFVGRWGTERKWKLRQSSVTLGSTNTPVFFLMFSSASYRPTKGCRLLQAPVSCGPLVAQSLLYYARCRNSLAELSAELQRSEIRSLLYEIVYIRSSLQCLKQRYVNQSLHNI